jgi:hypothetical protein
VDASQKIEMAASAKRMVPSTAYWYRSR